MQVLKKLTCKILTILEILQVIFAKKTILILLTIKTVKFQV